MSNIALLGAGFSKNWGGWLANEFFNVLIGKSLDTYLREMLLTFRKEGGFEATLAKLQNLAANSGQGSQAELHLIAFQDALAATFTDMEQAFIGRDFEFQHDKEYLVRTFLTRFDAIYTLNQDLLLERFYLNDNVMLADSRKWDGWNIPGMMPPSGASIDATARYLGGWRTDPNGISLGQRMQPIIKLHGSTNWFGTNDRRMLILGGNKSDAIDQFAVLKWNHDRFRASLMKPDTRLTIIGYTVIAPRGPNRYVIPEAGGDELSERNND